jgi:hypothetical protein
MVARPEGISTRFVYPLCRSRGLHALVVTEVGSEALVPVESVQKSSSDSGPEATERVPNPTERDRRPHRVRTSRLSWPVPSLGLGWKKDADANGARPPRQGTDHLPHSVTGNQDPSVQENSWPK